MTREEGNYVPPDRKFPRPLRLLIAAGGTGGHIYPGLAVGCVFAERHPDAAVEFVGTDRGLEDKIIGAAGFPVRRLRAEPLRGGSLARKIRGVAALMPAYLGADRLLRDFRPDAVFGVGGYTAGPLLLAAALRRIPTLILEPNFDPGLTNRWLARFVDAAAVAWEETAEHFRGKAFLSGNPVRAEIAAVPDVSVADDDGLRVFLFGGSQGSRILNDAMIAALPALPDRIEITHQTGASDHERVRRAYEEAGIAARVTGYVTDMQGEYARCHVVISRAGATTCAELAAAGRGAILVPLELAGAHQRYNAEALQRHGAAHVLPETELNGATLAATLDNLARSPRRCREMGDAARGHAKPGAAGTIVDKLEALIAAR